jgi:hypothetical protein
MAIASVDTQLSRQRGFNTDRREANICRTDTSWIGHKQALMKANHRGPLMLDREIIERCKSRLIAVASARDTIKYSELAAHLGIANQSIGRYLNEIYVNETALGHPDITLVAVYAHTGLGRNNSKGAQSIIVEPDNAHDVATYKAGLKRVYDHWSSAR